MPKSLPILGYSSMRAACSALAAQGLPPAEIGERIGRSSTYVTAALTVARDGLADRRLLLPLKMSRALAEEAKVRGVTVTQLVEQLLEVVVRDELYEALLGEPEGSGHA